MGKFIPKEKKEQDLIIKKENKNELNLKKEDVNHFNMEVGEIKKEKSNSLSANDMITMFEDLSNPKVLDKKPFSGLPKESSEDIAELENSAAEEQKEENTSPVNLSNASKQLKNIEILPLVNLSNASASLENIETLSPENKTREIMSPRAGERSSPDRLKTASIKIETFKESPKTSKITRELVAGNDLFKPSIEKVKITDFKETVDNILTSGVMIEEDNEQFDKKDLATRSTERINKLTKELRLEETTKNDDYVDFYRPLKKSSPSFTTNSNGDTFTNKLTKPSKKNELIDFNKVNTLFLKLEPVKKYENTNFESNNSRNNLRSPNSPSDGKKSADYVFPVVKSSTSTIAQKSQDADGKKIYLPIQPKNSSRRKSFIQQNIKDFSLEPLIMTNFSPSIGSGKSKIPKTQSFANERENYNFNNEQDMVEMAKRITSSSKPSNITVSYQEKEIPTENEGWMSFLKRYFTCF
jgi:hypothetical protein